MLKQPLGLFRIALLWVGVLFAQESRAKAENRFHLPEGALARLGNGTVTRHSRSVVYSPDGTRLAVVSTLGIWLFDSGTGEEVALLQSDREQGLHYETGGVSFSPGWPNAGQLRYHLGQEGVVVGRGQRSVNNHPGSPLRLGHFGVVFPGWQNPGHWRA